MVVAEAQFATDRASRYLQQLCKHFEHKLPVSFTPQDGRIEFASGVCRLAAAQDRLTLRAEAPDEPALGQLEGVIVRHLERFAFRDPPQIAWRRVADPG